MPKLKPDKPNAKGRNGKKTGSAGAVLIVRRSLWLSPQVSALSPLERTLIMELTAMYSGPKAGKPDVVLSVRDAAKRCGVSDHHAITKAFANLTALGLTAEASAAHFAVKAGGKSKARGWRLNWKDEAGGQVAGDALPSLNFKLLDAKQKRRIADRSKAIEDYTKGNSSVVDSTTMENIRGLMASESVAETATLTPKNGSFALPSIVGDSTTYIYYQGGTGAEVSELRNSMRKCGWPLDGSEPMFARLPDGGARYCDLVNLRRQAHNRPLESWSHK